MISVKNMGSLAVQVAVDGVQQLAVHSVQLKQIPDGYGSYINVHKTLFALDYSSEIKVGSIISYNSKNYEITFIPEYDSLGILEAIEVQEVQ